MVDYKLVMKFKRIFFFPVGFIKDLYQIGINGSRDIFNYVRFKDSTVDSGVCIDEKSIICSKVHILHNTIVNNSKIESYSYVGKNCIIQNTHISKFCSIANDVCIGLGSHPLTNFSTSPLFYRKNNTLNIDLIRKDLDFEEYKHISIGPDVWIGSRAILLDGINIGTGAVIAANSVVTKNVAPYAIVAGVPAKIIRFRFKEAEVESLLNSRWWELDLNEIKSLFNI